ncbi:MAG: hypoxanthine-guanine phosphoribosyltransferase [Gammaproteobacteria bacterium]|nr:hypoxanthine-guanine phosphoribosyltransferase [Gammaproteobacteria bacterium]MBU1731165.1 hypoxanthine-guanine phosphoribosyltransferase [Gammaproteobacteria bacterium]MBU1891476.1 hypoxanthine-guanine phosphoribosyltransferase [Gammaproteobacteria bacterium]
MMNEAWKIRQEAEQLVSAEEVDEVMLRLAGEISHQLADKQPLVLSVMTGATVFAGQLLPLLDFPLDFDYVQVSRYGDAIRGGQMVWKVPPPVNVKGRVVLVLDDILDEGVTLAEIRRCVMELGAAECYSAVFVNKLIERSKPIRADFVGLDISDRYVFGFGMDVRGAWRNLPAIYALKEE